MFAQVEGECGAKSRIHPDRTAAVIAIIAILRRCCCRPGQREAARPADQCINNLRQLQLASRMYYDDTGTFIGPITNNPDFSPGDWMGPC